MKANAFTVIACLVVAAVCLIPVGGAWAGSLNMSRPGYQAGSVPTGMGIPAAVFPEKDYSFEKALEGDEVSHTFIVRNTGTAVLEIQKVHTG